MGRYLLNDRFVCPEVTPLTALAVLSSAPVGAEPRSTVPVVILWGKFSSICLIDVNALKYIHILSPIQWSVPSMTTKTCVWETTADPLCSTTTEGCICLGSTPGRRQKAVPLESPAFSLMSDMPFNGSEKWQTMASKPLKNYIQLKWIKKIINPIKIKNKSTCNFQRFNLVTKKN